MTVVRTTVHAPLDLDVLADGLGFPEGPCIRDDGAVLAVDIDRGTVVEVDTGGRVRVVAKPGDGPNGLALTAGGGAYVANNGGFLWTEVDGVRIPIDRATHTNEPPGFEGGAIEYVDLATGEVAVLHDRVDGRPLRGPNDLVVDEVGGLWFTDHGKGRHASVDRGGLYYVPPGGEAEEVAFPLLGPNGVGLAPDGRTVYVAETHTGRLWAWDLDCARRRAALTGVARGAPRRSLRRRHAVLVRLPRGGGGRSHRHRCHRRRDRRRHARRRRGRRPPDPR